MPKSKIRVVLDTNLWISYLIAKQLRKIDRLFDHDEIILFFSQELIEEFIEVASRKKFKKYFSKERIEELLEMFDYFGEMVEVKSKVAVCLDEKDNFLLALAKDGKADFLVTGDEDLLIIKKFEDTEILTYSEFELRIE